ncbi:MAG: hypothetical protein A2X68_11050 [Ignavibacteria bacterium GWC2_56_12]|nr:MAG: hypothetical protein A2X68_11050 [Ignavibacteria bacterium GWC2_56_12]
MRILGLSAYYHDSAAAIVIDGKPIAAAQEERFTRKKHDASFPRHAVRYCMSAAGLSMDDLDAVVFYEKPFVKFERLLTTIVATAPRNMRQYLAAMPVWMREKLWLPASLRKELGYNGRLLFTSHHRSHAASAFFCSGFPEASVLTIDGVGEWETATRGYARNLDITLTHKISFPHSLGLLYSAFTGYLGFKVNSGEYKVMGLAPYGTPRYESLIRDHLIDVHTDGSFHVHQECFAYTYGLRMFNGKFERLFGRPAREPASALDQFHKDVAASVQKVTSDVMVLLAAATVRETGIPDLCMAGGVALNCVANANILREAGVRRLFVQPAAGDAGGALGAALDVFHSVERHPRSWKMEHAYFGPEFSDEEIGQVLEQYGVPFEKCDRQGLLDRTARAILDQDVVGWFQGRMEWGPRALGNRSILADARNPHNQRRVNEKIKFRESFRPFAPAVTEEHFSEWFAGPQDEYMLVTCSVRSDKRVLPSVTHVDGSARTQTVKSSVNPLFHGLLSEVGRQSGCPVVINTSFNVRGEPIVCTPVDALRCFFSTNIDSLAMGGYFVQKSRTSHVDASRFGDLKTSPD